jgi:lipopolysaccharide export LptBFGC system permease protein LptF
VRLLDRYIGRQLLVTAIFAVIVLSVVLVLGNVFKRLLDLLVTQNAPPSLIFSFIAYVLPFSLTFTIPWGFLTAVLLVFGRLSAENELTALRASGVSIPRACYPVWAIGFVLTLICLWINLEVAPRAQKEMKEALFNILKSNPLALFGSDRVIEEFPNQKIYVEEASGTTLRNIHLYELAPDGTLRSAMFARKGSLEVEPKDAPPDVEQKIILRYQDARFEIRDEKYPDDISKWRPGITVNEGSTEISLRDLYEKKQKSGGVGTMALAELLATNRPEGVKELNKRYSNALATLAFALLAVPLAVTAQRKETSAGFAISLAIGLSYYLFFFLADMAQNRPKWHPELLVWVPNLVFLVIGAARFRRLAAR